MFRLTRHLNNWPRGYKTWVQSQNQNKAQWVAACGHVPASSQSLRLILSVRLYSNFITSMPGLLELKRNAHIIVFEPLCSHCIWSAILCDQNIFNTVLLVCICSRVPCHIYGVASFDPQRAIWNQTHVLGPTFPCAGDLPLNCLYNGPKRVSSSTRIDTFLSALETLHNTCVHWNDARSISHINLDLINALLWSKPTLDLRLKYPLNSLMPFKGMLKMIRY